MCGFQEMDSIVDQMMTVAEYIGWETKELRPVRNVYLIYIVLIYTVKIIHIYIFKFVYIWLYISDTSRNDVRNRLRLWRHCFFRGMETWWNDYHSTSCTSWLRHGKERNLACINSTFAIFFLLKINKTNYIFGFLSFFTQTEYSWWWGTYVETKAFQQTRLLQSMSKHACWNGKKRPQLHA